MAVSSFPRRAPFTGLPKALSPGGFSRFCRSRTAEASPKSPVNGAPQNHKLSPFLSTPAEAGAYIYEQALSSRKREGPRNESKHLFGVTRIGGAP